MYNNKIYILVGESKGKEEASKKYNPKIIIKHIENVSRQIPLFNIIICYNGLKGVKGH